MKQHLAAVRALFDWLVTGGVMPFNPASAVRGPKHSTRKGKTPVLVPEEVRADHTQLYDRRSDEVTLDEVERVGI